MIIKESRIHFVWLERLLIAFFSRKRLKNQENASKIAEKVGICVKNKLIVYHYATVLDIFYTFAQ